MQISSKLELYREYSINHNSELLHDVTIEASFAKVETHKKLI